ncbi:MAG: histidine ammonia-lyase [Ignavibacteriae bacterium]|nr:histidine ammonia-lyase [Ignavibacteriota bacterium]MCB9216886.1 histidine ammonia-lyase [Ignavibacteria bacterium]
MTIRLDGDSLTIENVAQIAHDTTTTVSLAESALPLMEGARKVVEEWVEKEETIYGVTTGFGEFANVVISRNDLERLQENLIRSHAVGAGDPMAPELVRAMMALRINALAKGYSGIRISTVQRLIDMLNRNVIPVVPRQGSVGSSGDLVQLAHLVLAAIGEGEVWRDGIPVPSSPELERMGIEPIRLQAKEGLALINGTQMMTAFGCLAVDKAVRLATTADIIGALSVEGLKGTDRAYDERLHNTRPHVGQRNVAANMRALMEGSDIRESHRHNDDRVQDAYSLRCIPQIHGASRDGIEYVRSVLEIEINSATDNPLIFAEDREYIEGGNFHGQPVALPLDFLGIALSELANVSERRTERLVNGALSRLPRFLTKHGGLNSGYMIAQYTAASIVSENKVLAHPASVDSIPTSANQEDHNSMGSIAARKALQIAENLESVLAIEYLCACQGIDFHEPLLPGKGLTPAYQLLRQRVPHLEEDRVLHEDLVAARELVASGEVVEVVRSVLGDRLL